MATDDSNLIGMRLGVDDFRHFLPELPDCAANCSAPCEQIWLKVWETDGRGYGNGSLKIHFGAPRCAGAAAKKLEKFNDFFPIFCPSCQTVRLVARPPVGQFG